MTPKRMFPCALALCSLLGLFAATVNAQTADNLSRPRTTITIETDGRTRLETDPIIISRAEDEERSTARPVAVSPAPRLARLDQLLLAAIDTRLGAPYVYGATGPDVFDCSGFVWSVFQSAGVRFDRGSARALWSRFTPARRDEEFKFGTLVFFSNLSHVGIVADEHGFYHASRSHGVVYSPFNDYWLSRIDGFRRVPLPAPLAAE
jgi:cell wall-associated NlpC family hydrolase